MAQAWIGRRNVGNNISRRSEVKKIGLLAWRKAGAGRAGREKSSCDSDNDKRPRLKSGSL